MAAQQWGAAAALYEEAAPLARKLTTLPSVAEALVRLSEAREGQEAARRMEAQAEALLGPGWRPPPQR